MSNNIPKIRHFIPTGVQLCPLVLDLQLIHIVVTQNMVPPGTRVYDVEGIYRPDDFVYRATCHAGWTNS